MTDTPTVFEAWSAVMQDVQSIEKGEFNKAQGFRFRGIDQVMDVVGPALRRHGVIVVPTGTDLQPETYQTAKGTPMRNAMVTMQYTVYGPGGDYFVGVSFGESADAGDKAVTKAQSVALRTFLLQSLMVPTGDPDPDASTYERASAPPPQRKRSYADTERDLLLEFCNKHKLDVRKIGARFADDYGLAVADADVETLRAFRQMLTDECAVDDAAAADG